MWVYFRSTQVFLFICQELEGFFFFFNTVTFPALVAILNLNGIFKITIPCENSGSDSQIMCNATHLASRGSKLLIDL